MYIKGEENMKNKTMLRFLLCFLMISVFGIICFQPISLAAMSSENFFNAGRNNFNKIINGEIKLEIVDGGVTVIKEGVDVAPAIHIYKMILGVGVAAAVVVVAIYAIQWMMATPAKRQELKAGMWPLIIGVFLLICGSALTPKIYDMFSNDSGSLSDIIKNTGGTVSSIVVKVGYVVGVVMILAVGIQWLISPPNKRQELKGRMINVFIGATLLVTGVTILGFVAKVAGEIGI